MKAKILSFGMILFLLFGAHFISLQAETICTDADATCPRGDTTVGPEEVCEPDVIVHGMMVFVPVEGGCWVFQAEDGTNYEPYGGPPCMYVDGLRGIMYAATRPWASICMVGIIVEVCDFEADGCNACMDNTDCMWPSQYCEKTVGDCDGLGFCADRPEICLLYYDPVCGCDGSTYGNECAAASMGVSLAYYGPCETPCFGDFDSDGDVDGSDLTSFAADFGRTDCPEEPSCYGDFDNDGDVDGSDLARFAADFGRRDCPVSPRIEEYSNSGCLSGSAIDSLSDRYPWCDDDKIEILVEGNRVHVIHRNATYNCCPDDIEFSLVAEGNILKLTESEVLTNPCNCMCCYDVKSTIAGLMPGAYTLELCWVDYEMGQIRCYTEKILIRNLETHFGPTNNLYFQP